MLLQKVAPTAVAAAPPELAMTPPVTAATAPTIVSAGTLTGALATIDRAATPPAMANTPPTITETPVPETNQRKCKNEKIHKNTVPSHHKMRVKRPHHSNRKIAGDNFTHIILCYVLCGITRNNSNGSYHRMVSKVRQKSKYLPPIHKNAC